MLPASTAVRYLATGLGGGGRFRGSSWTRASGFVGMRPSSGSGEQLGERLPLLSAFAAQGQGGGRLRSLRRRRLVDEDLAARRHRQAGAVGAERDPLAVGVNPADGQQFLAGP